MVPGESEEYDVNSAYPAIIARLPCLLHGVYSKGMGIPQVGEEELCIVYANVWSPGMPGKSSEQTIGAMLHRDEFGRILRPMATEGWYWWDELQAAIKAGVVKRFGGKGGSQVNRWVKYVPCDCKPPMEGIRGLYGKRLEVGKKSPLGKAAKLVYNSAYGKFAQSIGEPIFGNPIYASRITSGCRKQILEAIATHPKGIQDVTMVATDAVYFITPHPKLPINDSLGSWDYKKRSNLTLFKPGVYWDDETRATISEGGNPYFKTRGFRAADFASSIVRIDSEFESWNASDATTVMGGDDWKWPCVEFFSTFTMTTALQALRQHDWSHAGHVTTGKPLIQNSNPSDKRINLHADRISRPGETIFRSFPHFGMVEIETDNGFELDWVPSVPYSKRFGLEDPWSDEYKEQYGVTEDGNVIDILSWLLKGE
jgi:hypothetical protein